MISEGLRNATDRSVTTRDSAETRARVTIAIASPAADHRRRSSTSRPSSQRSFFGAAASSGAGDPSALRLLDGAETAILQKAEEWRRTVSL
jgi:hypothetical protein